jgi:hypothetical protein
VYGRAKHDAAATQSVDDSHASVRLAISGVFITALLPMVTGGNVVANNPADLVANGWSPSAAEDISKDIFPFLDKILRGVFAFVIIGIAWGIITKAKLLIKRMT